MSPPVPRAMFRAVLAVLLAATAAGCWQPRAFRHDDALRELQPSAGASVRAEDAGRPTAATGVEDAWLRAALANHPAVQTVRAQAAVASAAARVARLPRNPELRLNNEIGGDAQTSDRLAVAAQIWVPNPATQGAVVGGAKAKIPAAEAAAQSVLWQTRSQLRLALLQLQLAQAKAQLAQRQVALDDRKASWLQRASASGAVPPVEAEWAQVAAVQSREAAAVAADQRALAANVLQSLSRLAPDHPALQAVVSTAALPPCLVPPETTLAPQLLADHPALRARAASWQVADAAVDAAKGSWLPSLHYIQLGVQRREVDGRNDLRFGAAVEIPVFSWLGDSVSLAEAEREQARLAFQAEALLRWQVVQDRASRWQTAAAQTRRLQDEVMPAQQAALERARGGVAAKSWTEALVFAAEQRLLDTERQQLEAKALCHNARLELIDALGREVP